MNPEQGPVIINVDPGNLSDGAQILIAVGVVSFLGLLGLSHLIEKAGTIVKDSLAHSLEAKKLEAQINCKSLQAQSA